MIREKLVSKMLTISGWPKDVNTLLPVNLQILELVLPVFGFYKSYLHGIPTAPVIQYKNIHLLISQ